MSRTKNNIRGTERANLRCARVFFDILSQDGYKVHFRDQINNRQMAQIINEVLGEFIIFMIRNSILIIKQNLEVRYCN